jgi:hypothetical protein
VLFSAAQRAHFVITLQTSYTDTDQTATLSYSPHISPLISNRQIVGDQITKTSFSMSFLWAEQQSKPVSPDELFQLTQSLRDSVNSLNIWRLILELFIGINFKVIRYISKQTKGARL